MSELKISCMTSGIFLKSQIRIHLEQCYAKKLEADLCLEEFTCGECAFHESFGRNEQTYHTSASVSHNQTELCNALFPNP